MNNKANVNVNEKKEEKVCKDGHDKTFISGQCKKCGLINSAAITIDSKKLETKF